MALRLSDFPRPCFYKDLTRLAAAGKLRSALIVGDVPSGDLCLAVEGWREVLPDVAVTLLCSSPVPADVREALRTIPGVTPLVAASLGQGLIEAVPTRTAESSQHARRAPDIVVTCAPYDSYGTLVKHSLETAILEFMKATDARFVIHDPVFRVARIYDRALLADRLRARPRRLAFYRRAVRLLLWVTRLLSRLPAPGWRRVR